MGGVLTGVQGVEGNSSEIFNGRVNGDAWRVSIKNPMPLTLAFAGKVSGESMSGELGIGPMGIYGLFGLSAVRLSLAPRRERLVGALAGAVTGSITAGTGVFVIPAVPYLQAIGLEKDELVQALGLSFTVSTLALAVNVGLAGALTWSLAMPTAWALVTACLGMWIGQNVRTRLSPVVFRRWFFLGLLILGIYLVAPSVV